MTTNTTTRAAALTPATPGARRSASSHWHRLAPADRPRVVATCRAEGFVDCGHADCPPWICEVPTYNDGMAR